MRLLSTQKSETDDFTIQEFTDYAIPPYAILSHVWGPEEVSYQEINDPYAKNKQGYQKITDCCLVAKSNGFKYVWIDTCCIDKRSSAELSEAINSMYFWYQNAEVCYAHLADAQFESEIPKSRWMTRGWTLQELIAPSRVIFLNEKWEVLGSKANLRDVISECTGIPSGILSGEEGLEASSVAQRMSWAAQRQTTRVEDTAYSLMDMFSVNMPLIYGEGERAFIRLQEEIMRILDDHSLFAWSSPDNRGGLLATSPAAFASCRNIVRSDPFGTLDSPFTMSSRGVHLDLRFIGIGCEGLGFAILLCRERSEKEKLMAIYLRDTSLDMRLFERVQSEKIERLDLKIFRPSQYPVRRLCIQAGRTTRIGNPNALKRNSVCLDQIYPDDKLTLLMDFKNPTALFDVVMTGQLDHLWLLLTRSDVKMETTDGFGQTPLSWAAKFGHESTVNLLLERGADIDIKDEDGRTPLSWAVGRGHESTVKLLGSRMDESREDRVG